MRKLNAITEQESGWLAVISSMVEVIPMEDPLGPANITLLLDDCPLPSKETIHKLVELLGLTPVDWSARKWDANRHQNVAIVLGCLAEKLAGPRSIELFSEHILDYLLANMVILLRQNDCHDRCSNLLTILSPNRRPTLTHL